MRERGWARTSRAVIRGLHSVTRALFPPISLASFVKHLPSWDIGTKLPLHRRCVWGLSLTLHWFVRLNPSHVN